MQIKKITLNTLGLISAVAVPFAVISCSPDKLSSNNTHVETPFNYDFTANNTEYIIHDGDTIEITGVPMDQIYAAEGNIHQGVKPHKIGLRLFGVDTPEVSFLNGKTWAPTTGIAKTWGDKATEYVKNILDPQNTGNKLSLSILGLSSDSYLRPVVRIKTSAFDLGLELIKNGYARVAYTSGKYINALNQKVKPGALQYINALESAEKVAKSQNKGLWAITNKDISKYSLIFPKATMSGHQV